jgi:hypothetical protein
LTSGFNDASGVELTVLSVRTSVVSGLGQVTLSARMYDVSGFGRIRWIRLLRKRTPLTGRLRVVISGGGLLEKLLLSFAAAALFVLVARCFVGGFTIVGAYGAVVER